MQLDLDVPDYSTLSRKASSMKIPKTPGKKGPSQDIINLVLEFKKRNPRFDYLRIAMQIKNPFGIKINSHVVRRILNKYFQPNPGDTNEPSWLTFLGHTKDSLWSLDLFRCNQ
jgi:putative transposase